MVYMRCIEAIAYLLKHLQNSLGINIGFNRKIWVAKLTFATLQLIFVNKITSQIYIVPDCKGASTPPFTAQIQQYMILFHLGEQAGEQSVKWSASRSQIIDNAFQKPDQYYKRHDHIDLSCPTLLPSEKSLSCYRVDPIATEIAFLSHEMRLY